MQGNVIQARLPVPVGTLGTVRGGKASSGFTEALRVAESGLASRTSDTLSTGLGPGWSAPAASEGRSAAFEELTKIAAQRAGIDEQLVKAVAEAESNFNPRAVSPAGAKGLMQLMDGTARGLGVKDPFDPAANLEGGARYLRSMLDRFGSIPMALAAYNAGPGAVEQFGGIPPFQETRVYVDRVMQLLRRNQQSAAATGSDGAEGGRHA